MDPAYLIGQIIGIIVLIIGVPTFILMLIGICKLGDEPVKFTYEIEVKGDSEKASKDEKED